MSCSICAQIAPSIHAQTGRDEYLPPEVRPLEKYKDRYDSLGTDTDLWECPECTMLYIYTTETAFTGSGVNDADTLDRMTREQSDVVHAMRACTADPAAVEDALFALPGIALEHALSAAYRKDRDFLALFIPRLVHECAMHTHSTRATLHGLIEHAPSYAREVLAAVTSLPDELRTRLRDLEQRCLSAS